MEAIHQFCAFSQCDRTAQNGNLHSEGQQLAIKILCGTKFLRVLILAVFSAIRKKSSRQKKKKTRKKFPAKIYSTVDILMVDMAQKVTLKTNRMTMITGICFAWPHYF